MGSTYQTWVKVCAFHNIKQGVHWKLNGQYHYIEFTNGSRIDLLDVKYAPSDPLYERFGSSEYTDGAMEECGEIDFRAFDVLKSRVGRHKNDEFKIRPTLALTGNPKKNWTYSVFYLPAKNNLLPAGYAFIQALYGDNQHTSALYERSLSNLKDKTLRDRLKDGNWEYDSVAGTLFGFDPINDLWSNTLTTVREQDKYMTVDVARFGDDKTVFYFWKGLQLYKKVVYQKQDIKVTAQKLKDYARTENIPYSHIIIDEDGVGGGVVDLCTGVYGFINNSTPLENEDARYEYLEKQNFSNLKTQCAWVMAKLTERHEVAISIPMEEDMQFYEEFNQELSLYRIKNPDNDTVKMALIPKDEMKAELGRSPDYGDAFIMRGFFMLKKQFAFMSPQEEDIQNAQDLLDTVDFDPFDLG